MANFTTDRATMIQQATGVALSDVIIIERLMAETILHSTLDWLSSAEFARTAREAHQLFSMAPAYFHTQQACIKATYKRMQSESRLEKAHAKNDSQAIARAHVQLSLSRQQEEHLAEICIRLGKAYFPSESA